MSNDCENAVASYVRAHKEKFKENLTGLAFSYKEFLPECLNRHKRGREAEKGKQKKAKNHNLSLSQPGAPSAQTSF